jgi:hypothetical protein
MKQLPDPDGKKGHEIRSRMKLANSEANHIIHPSHKHAFRKIAEIEFDEEKEKS